MKSSDRRLRQDALLPRPISRRKLRASMDASAAHRIRLWLRSEQAFGLNAVIRAPLSLHVSDGLDSAELQSATAVVPAPAATGLFPEAAPASAFKGSPSLPTAEKRALLQQIEQNQVRNCSLCRLCQQRRNTVFGEGDCDSRILFIGEGPGETEDELGRPFVGRAGQLLDRMIQGMGLRREQVYITNIVKCRPPGNRVPAPDEVAACTPFLVRQLEIIRPQVIVTLGLPATQYMLDTKLSMGRLRGQWHNWRGIKLMPTYHPAYVLRNPNHQTKSAVWSDLKQVLSELNLPIPKRKNSDE
jgi:uracil-DNA glycosylase